MIDIKTFIICMEQVKGERCDMKKIKKCFKDLNKFSAVIGKELDITNPQIVHPMTYSVITGNIGGDWTQIDSLGALGASMSHISLWKKCIELNQPIIVLEDDVRITCDKCKHFEQSLNEKPNDCDFLSLMYIRNKSTLSTLDTEKFKYMNDPYFMGAQAYYITPNAAKKLTQYALPITMHIDIHIKLLKHKV